MSIHDLKSAAVWMTLAVSVVTMFPGSVHAFGNSGGQAIFQIHVSYFFGHIRLTGDVGDWANPDGCDRSNEIILEKENPMYRETYAAILAAHFTGTPFSAGLDGCESVAGDTYPIITNINTVQ